MWIVLHYCNSRGRIIPIWRDHVCLVKLSPRYGCSRTGVKNDLVYRFTIFEFHTYTLLLILQCCVSHRSSRSSRKSVTVAYRRQINIISKTNTTPDPRPPTTVPRATPLNFNSHRHHPSVRSRSPEQPFRQHNTMYTTGTRCTALQCVLGALICEILLLHLTRTQPIRQ
jgi:hypothetical protein